MNANIQATNAATWQEVAEKSGIPLRTVDQVRADLADARARAKGKNAGIDVSLARLMLRHGRLTDDARTYIKQEYPQ